MASEEHAPLIVGKISGVFGVKGWIKVFDYSRERGDVLQYGKWLLGRKGHSPSARLRKGKSTEKGSLRNSLAVTTATRRRPFRETRSPCGANG